MTEEEKAACEELARYREQLLREAQEDKRKWNDPFRERLQELSADLLRRPRAEQQPAGPEPSEDLLKRLERKEKPLRGFYTRHHYWKHIRYAALCDLLDGDGADRNELLFALEVEYAQHYECRYLAFRELFAQAEHRFGLLEYPVWDNDDLEHLEHALPLAAGVIAEDEEAFYVAAPWPLRPLVEGRWWRGQYGWSEQLYRAAVELLEMEKKLAAVGYGAEKRAPAEPF